MTRLGVLVILLGYAIFFSAGFVAGWAIKRPVQVPRDLALVDSVVVYDTVPGPERVTVKRSVRYVANDKALDSLRAVYTQELAERDSLFNDVVRWLGEAQAHNEELGVEVVTLRDSLAHLPKPRRGCLW